MKLENIMQRYPKEKEYLIEILIDIDNEKDNHYVSEQEINKIARYLSIKESHICSVMSFYTLLSTNKRGKYIIQICKDVPCYLNDFFNVKETVCNFLSIRMGETTSDNLFTVESTACIGCCDEAPAMKINDKLHTKLTKRKVIAILEEIKGGLK